MQNLDFLIKFKSFLIKKQKNKYMLHAFTKNYNDLSTEAGFQYEFYCD